VLDVGVEAGDVLRQVGADGEQALLPGMHAERSASQSDGLAASVSSSPAGEAGETQWGRLGSAEGAEGGGGGSLLEPSALSVSSVEQQRSACFAEKSRQSVCSEESFCCDARSMPTLPTLPLELKDGIGSSVDRMTVASEASTRSLGSEQSTMSVSGFESAHALPHKSPPDNVPPSPGPRSAEAQLEASKRAMESLLS
jgi:hypothetical protein